VPIKESLQVGGMIRNKILESAKKVQSAKISKKYGHPFNKAVPHPLSTAAIHRLSFIIHGCPILVYIQAPTTTPQNNIMVKSGHTKNHANLCIGQ
jgi:hypothetical protein